MTNFYKILLLCGAILPLASRGQIDAAEPAEKKAKEKPALPIGYEEAAPPKKKKTAKKKEVAKPKEIAPGAKKPTSELPIGYEEAGTSGKPKRKTRRQAPVPAVPAKNAKAVAEQKKKIANNLLIDNPQIKALAAQMQQQLKPYFAAELNFVKTVCQPNPEQLLEIKALAVPELEKAIRAFAIQQAPQMGIGIRGFRGKRQDPEGLLKQFEEAAARIVSRVFSDEVTEVYQDEQKHRTEFRTRAGAMALVAHLDVRFRFSPSQREALTDSFQKEWRLDWQKYLQIMANNPQYFPPVPDEAVLPHLNDTQTKQWKGRPRQSLGLHWQNLVNRGGVFQNLKQEIDWFEKPEEKQKDVVLGVRQFMNAVVVPFQAVQKAAKEAQEK